MVFYDILTIIGFEVIEIPNEDRNEVIVVSDTIIGIGGVDHDMSDDQAFAIFVW